MNDHSTKFRPDMFYLTCLGWAMFIALLAGIDGYHNMAGLNGWAKALEALVAVTIIPEAYATGFRAAWAYWSSRRAIALLFWLSLGLAATGVAVAITARWLGLESPNGVAAGLLATDPAAVGLALGLVKGSHLLGLFWQMTVESILNDAVGISVYGWAQGQAVSEAVRVVGYTITTGLMLSFAQVVVQLVSRKLRRSSIVELNLVLATNVAFVIYGMQHEMSLILLTGVGSLTTNALGAFLPTVSEHRAHELSHQWERLNQFGLGAILVVVMFLAPVRTIFTTPSVIGAGLALLAAVSFSRMLVDFGHKAVLKALLARRGHAFAVEEATVNWLCGSTRLGVPSIVAIHLAAHGHTADANAMFAAILFSGAFVPLGVWVIQHVEAHFACENPEPWPPIGRKTQA